MFGIHYLDYDVSLVYAFRSIIKRKKRLRLAMLEGKIDVMCLSITGIMVGDIVLTRDIYNALAALFFEE